MMQRNPFSTRFVRPGQIPFLFSEEDSLDAIITAMKQTQKQGAIIGPHGSGKSTLLETLSQQWSKVGLVEQRVRLTASRNREPIPLGDLDDSSLLVVDGFEQLSFWKQRWIRWRCKHKGARLLVTAHGECGVPIVFQTKPNWPLACKLSSMLLACDITAYEEELHAVWEEDPGDIRAYFFRLYHWCELHGIYLSSRQDMGRQGLPI